MPPDDRQLLLGIARGRDDSARELWRRFGPALTALARSIVGEAAAGDVVQAAFCRILELPTARLREINDVPAWLATLVRHQATNYLRTERRQRRKARARPPAETVRPSHDGALWPLVERLPRRWREVIVLRLVAGLSFDQLALALGQNRSTAAARYRAALARLRESAPACEESPGGVGHVV